MDGYEFITNTDELNDFTTGNAGSRKDATVHNTRITITPDKKMSVEWQVEGDTGYTSLIDEYQCTLNCPSNVMFGFTAGTESLSANHEIRNISVSEVIPEPASVLMVLFSGLTGFWIRRRFMA